MPGLARPHGRILLPPRLPFRKTSVHCDPVLAGGVAYLGGFAASHCGTTCYAWRTRIIETPTGLAGRRRNSLDAAANGHTVRSLTGVNLVGIRKYPKSRFSFKSNRSLGKNPILGVATACSEVVPAPWEIRGRPHNLRSRHRFALHRCPYPIMLAAKWAAWQLTGRSCQPWTRSKDWGGTKFGLIPRDGFALLNCEACDNLWRWPSLAACFLLSGPRSWSGVGDHIRFLGFANSGRFPLRSLASSPY